MDAAEFVDIVGFKLEKLLKYADDEPGIINGLLLANCVIDDGAVVCGTDVARPGKGLGIPAINICCC